ncbi:MAG TPA: glucose-6-phosphate isomerase [Pseudonocardia sp.]|nr:glucose-6-phosphate isomerase [Pseudonocardia sp.]
MPRLEITAAPPAALAARLAADAVASRTAAAPGWAAAPRTSRPLAGHVAALREQLRVAGLVRVLLVTADGVGMAAELLAGPHARLTVLDTTDPAEVADALAGDLEATALVVSLPPGADPTGPALVWDAVESALRAAAGGGERGPRTVVVTPPDGPLHARAHAAGATVVLGAPDVTGPWAALSAYALVPAGLAGAEPEPLLGEAVAAREALAADDPANPAVVLGALLAGAGSVVWRADDPFAEWAAGLVGAALGGRGPVPVVVESAGAPGWDTAALRVGAGGDARPEGGVAERIVLWQHAVAAAAHLLEVDPAPGTEVAVPARAAPPRPQAGRRDGDVEVHAGAGVAGTGVAGALRGLLAAIGTGADAHLAVHAYLDREADASAAVLRAELARRTGLTTSFGWAPRCLSGAGRWVGGAGHTGVLLLTGDPEPGTDPALSRLAEHQQAQAVAEAAGLARRGCPVLRLHLTDRLAGLVAVAKAVQALPPAPGPPRPDPEPDSEG